VALKFKMCILHDLSQNTPQGRQQKFTAVKRVNCWPVWV